MTFMQSLRVCLGPKYWFKIQGRASRSEYWWFALFVVLINIVTSLFWIFPPSLAVILNALAGLAVFPASFGVTARRLHDRDLSAWWLAVPFALLLVFGLAGSSLAAVAFLDLFSFAVSVGFIIVLCLPSQPGPNRFGACPVEGIKSLGA